MTVSWQLRRYQGQRDTGLIASSIVSGVEWPNGLSRRAHLANLRRSQVRWERPPVEEEAIHRPQTREMPSEGDGAEP